MAGPVGHIVCALALINSTNLEIDDKNAFFAGSVFPDIRYVAKNIERSTTHHMPNNSIEFVLEQKNSFKMGHYLHIWLDKEREEYMKKHKAYELLETKKYRTQILKIIEDSLLFDQLKNKINSHEVFNKIYQEEFSYDITTTELETWNKIQKNYLDTEYKSNFFRHATTAFIFFNSITTHKTPDSFFNKCKKNIKALMFFMYAYYKVQKFSSNKELKNIIFNFYNKHLPLVFSNSNK